MFIIYYLIDQNDEIAYVGFGNTDRAKDKTKRNKKHKQELEQGVIFRSFEVCCFRTREEAHEFEQQEIQRLKPRLNVKTKDTIRNEIPDNFKDLFYIDESSPSGLRFKKDNKGTGRHNKRYAGEVAGNKKYQHDGRPHGWQIMVSNKSYLVHRIVMFLAGKCSLTDSTKVVDHIDRNPFNNKLENLRVINYKQNANNSKIRKTNTIGVSGIHEHMSTGYTVSVRLKRKRISRYFAFGKYGKEKAFELAKQFREQYFSSNTT